MIRKRSRIMGVVAVALGVAAVVTPSATAMPFGGDGRGLAFPAYHPATTVASPNPDQQVPAAHATPSGVTPILVSTKERGTGTGSSFDWAALFIGIGAGGLLGLTIGAFTSASRRTRPVRRQRAAVSS